VTVGPNIAVYASADAAVTLAGHLQADVTIASWTIQQTYPQTAQYPADALDDPSNDGSQTVGQPTFEASVSASGEVALHLKPTVTFGIVFDSRWKVDPCSVDLVLDGYIIFHAELGLSTNGDNSCPFKYGIDGGSNIYAQLNAPSLFGWGGTTQIPIHAVPRKQLTPDNCESSAVSRRLMRRAELDQFLNSTIGTYGSSASDPHLVSSQMVGVGALSSSNSPALARRVDTFSLGPLITIPTGFLSCPSSSDEEDNTCPLCTSTGCSGGSCPLQRRDDEPLSEGMSCPWNPPPPDDACSDSSITKRAITTKSMTLSWYGTFAYSNYPSCSANSLSDVNGVPKWYMPQDAQMSSCTPAVAKYNKDSGSNTVNGISITKFNTDHVFEVQLVSGFLEWLCDTSSQFSYLSGRIGFPANWGRPDAVWCNAVLGMEQVPFTLPPQR